jgi:hypothetical protein
MRWYEKVQPTHINKGNKIFFSFYIFYYKLGITRAEVTAVTPPLH